MVRAEVGRSPSASEPLSGVTVVPMVSSGFREDIATCNGGLFSARVSVMSCYCRLWIINEESHESSSTALILH